MGSESFWNKIIKSKTVLPTRIAIKPANVDIGDQFKTAFEQDKHYFSIRVNEMFLSNKRSWFYEYDPIVFVLTEFIYGTKEVGYPFVVGKSMMDAKKMQVPQGMIFSDTRVAGLHPYAGGTLTLSIVLGQMKTNDYLEKLLNLIETFSGAVNQNIAGILSNAVGVAKVVIDGMDSLFDAEEVQPILGTRKEFDPDSKDVFMPGYFALINKPENQLEPSKFFVKENQLHAGDNMESSKPYRDSDYVLYSIVNSSTRSDDKTLSFYPLWKDLENYAGDLEQVQDRDKELLNTKLVALNSAIRRSSDLTTGQKAQLMESYHNQLSAIITPKKPLGEAKQMKAPKFEDELEKNLYDLDTKVFTLKI